MPDHCLMYMSTDSDILDVKLGEGWGIMPILLDYPMIEEGKGNLPAGTIIIIAAHGDNKMIGNQQPGVIDVSARAFITLIHRNMLQDAEPGAIYISACQKNHAFFAADVRNLADEDAIWENVSLYGHEWYVSGDIPGPGEQNGWREMIPRKVR